MKLPHCVETTIHTLFDENGDPKVSIPRGREILSPLYRSHEPENDWLCQRRAQAMRDIGKRHYHLAKVKLDNHTVVFNGGDGDFMVAETPIENREPDPPFDHDAYAPGISPGDFALLMPAEDKARYERLWRLYSQRQQWLFGIQDELLDAWFSLSGTFAMSL